MKMIEEKKISETLLRLSVPANNYGFKYLKLAVMLADADENYLHSVMRLYADVARQCGTTPQRAERAIRHAVEQAYMYGDIKIVEALGETDPDTGKLAAGRFIGALCEYLKYES